MVGFTRKILKPIDRFYTKMFDITPPKSTNDGKILFHPSGAISVNYNHPEVQRNIQEQIEILAQKFPSRG